MQRPNLPAVPLAIVCALILGAVPAQAAQKKQTWVSASGTDAGLCPISAPCATFQYAHNRTLGGGTLSVLSAGDYGPLLINRTISIVADGAGASILFAKGEAGIRVSAGADDVVSLRGLTIDTHLASGSAGIRFYSGAALHLDKVVILNADYAGISVNPSAGTSALHMTDSTVASSGIGIILEPTGSSNAVVVLDRVHLDGNQGAGLLLAGNLSSGSLSASVHNSVMARNGSGISFFETGGGSSVATIERTALVHNNRGLQVDGANATARIGDSTVSGNTSDGLKTSSGGTIESFGTNKVVGNGTDGTPDSTIALK